MAGVVIQEMLVAPAATGAAEEKRHVAVPIVKLVGVDTSEPATAPAGGEREEPCIVNQAPPAREPD